MSCGCKNKSTKNTDKDNNEFNFGNTLFVKLLLFMLSLILTLVIIIPLIIPFIVMVLFKKIVMNDDMDMTKTFLKMGNMFKKNKDIDDDNDEVEIEDSSEDINDYELLDVDVIK